MLVELLGPLRLLLTCLFQNTYQFRQGKFKTQALETLRLEPQNSKETPPRKMNGENSTKHKYSTCKVPDSQVGLTRRCRAAEQAPQARIQPACQIIDKTQAPRAMPRDRNAYCTYLLALASAFTLDGLSRHHQLS